MRYSKIVKLNISVLTVALLLGGCGRSSRSAGRDDIPGNNTIDIVSGNAESDEMIVVEKDRELVDGTLEGEELSDEDIASITGDILKNKSSNYAYNTLTGDEQIIYGEILKTIEDRLNEVRVSTTDTELIDKIFSCVMADHPEIFYIKGYSVVRYTRGGKLEKVTVSGIYTMDPAEESRADLAIEAYADKCISSYDGPDDDYEKVKYVYEYIIYNTEYDLDSENNQNIVSVFKDGRSVCQGYAKATQYLLNRMGVFCTIFEGVVKGTERHAWNIVRVNDRYYHVDTTWGDASYNLVTEEEEADFESPRINYDYLLVPDDVISDTHVIDSVIPAPPCYSMDDNYYVREGIYFTSLNPDQIAFAFANARARGDGVVTLKCSDSGIYAILFDYLINDNKIFDYMNGGTSVRYLEIKGQNRILFYI